MNAPSGFDVGKWQRFAVAAGPERQRLLNELVAENEGLTVTIVAQLCGRGEARAGRRQMFPKEPGAELLDPEEAHAAGQAGMLKAILGFKNPEKGGIAPYAAWKIRYELQCAIQTSTLIKTPRTAEAHERPRGYIFTGECEDADQEGHLLSRGSSVHMVDEVLEEDDEVQKPRPISALADFVERRCVFRGHSRSVWAHVVGAYERHALVLGFPSSPRQLGRALLERGARWVTVLDQRTGERARGVAGVRVLSLSELAR